jgi:hypothetical protein
VIKSIRNDDEAYAVAFLPWRPEVANTTSGGLMYHLAAPSTIPFQSVFLALHELSTLPPMQPSWPPPPHSHLGCHRHRDPHVDSTIGELLEPCLEREFAFRFQLWWVSWWHGCRSLTSMDGIETCSQSGSFLLTSAASKPSGPRAPLPRERTGGGEGALFHPNSR